MCFIFPVLQVSGEHFYADVAKDILLYVSRDLSDKVNVLRICQEVCVSLQAFCLGFFSRELNVLRGTTVVHKVSHTGCK